MIDVWASDAWNKVIVRVDYAFLFKTCYNCVTEHDQQHKHGCHICTVCVHSASQPRQRLHVCVDPSNLLHGMSLRDQDRGHWFRKLPDSVWIKDGLSPVCVQWSHFCNTRWDYSSCCLRVGLHHLGLILCTCVARSRHHCTIEIICIMIAIAEISSL